MIRGSSKKRLAGCAVRLDPTRDPRPATRAVAALVLLFAAAPLAAGEAEWKTFHDQASAHLRGGGLGQAELFARAALKEAETSLPPGHPSIEQSLSTLSAALRLQGKQAEALTIAQRLVGVRMKRYGPDQVPTAIALHNNAEILIALDRLAEAARLQARALAVFEKHLGEKHVNTATALHNMGAILLKQERYNDAEQYLRRALAAKQRVLKPGHLSIAHTLDNLSAALDALGRQIEAEKYKKRAEAIRRKAG